MTTPPLPIGVVIRTIGADPATWLDRLTMAP
jgi:hypothetical protein